MRLRFDDETESFRAEFAAWLDANVPDEAETLERSRSSAHLPDWARRWQRKLFDAGWLVPGNSPEYGGRPSTAEYNVAPNAQASEAGPGVAPRATSGAR